MDKTPTQRLKQFLKDNDALQKFWAKTKNANADSRDKSSKSL
jgi:hypothetical protein